MAENEDNTPFSAEELEKMGDEEVELIEQLTGFRITKDTMRQAKQVATQLDQYLASTPDAPALPPPIRSEARQRKALPDWQQAAQDLFTLLPDALKEAIKLPTGWSDPSLQGMQAAGKDLAVLLAAAANLRPEKTHQKEYSENAAQATDRFIRIGKKQAEEMPIGQDKDALLALLARMQQTQQDPQEFAGALREMPHLPRRYKDPSLLALLGADLPALPSHILLSMALGTSLSCLFQGEKNALYEMSKPSFFLHALTGRQEGFGLLITTVISALFFLSDLLCQKHSQEFTGSYKAEMAVIHASCVGTIVQNIAEDEGISKERAALAANLHELMQLYFCIKNGASPDFLTDAISRLLEKITEKSASVNSQYRGFFIELTQAKEHAIRQETASMMEALDRGFALFTPDLANGLQEIRTHFFELFSPAFLLTGQVSSSHSNHLYGSV